MGRGEPKSEKLIQDYVSKWYQIRYSGNGFLYHARIVTDLLNGIKFKDGRASDKVLDVGCGVGFVSQLYPNFDIQGIDISDGMLERNPYKHIKASAENIPFPDNHFDFVVCRSLLHHLEDPIKGLMEMFRVLKPSGVFSCWDPNHNVTYETIRHLFQKTDRFSHLHKSFNDEELFGMIENTGLKIIEKRYIGFVGYPLLGFPDIIDFHVPLWLAKIIIKIDNLISKTPFKKLSWSLMIKAVKSV